MTSPFLKKIVLFSLLCLSATPFIMLAKEEEATTSSTQTAQKNKKQETSVVKAGEEAQKLNMLHAELRKQLDTLMGNAQTCAQFIIMRKMNPKNPHETFFWIQSFMELARKASQIPHVPVTSYKLSRSIKINTQLIAALNEAYKSGFASLPDLDELEKAVKKIENDILAPKTTKISLAILNTSFSENQNAIEKLTKTIQSGGITWYNSLYRKCVELNQKFSITPVIVNTAIVTGLSSAVLYSMSNLYEGNDPSKDNIIASIQRWLHTTKFGEFVKDMGDHGSNVHHRYMGVQAGIASIGVLHQLGIFKTLQETWSNIDARLIGATPINYQSLQYVNTDFTLEDKMFDSVRHLLDPFHQILTFLKNPDLYIHGGQKIPKCVLLAGPPGSGKTHSARAFAGSIQKLYEDQGKGDKVGFIVMEPHEMIEDKIQEAKANAPCVLFIDEFHLHNGGQQTANGMWLSKMLTEIDKVDKTDDPMRQVFIVTATNRPDLLAKALLRDGRFGEDARVNFSVPDYEQRKSVISALCNAAFIKLTPTETEYMARLTQDCAFSSINKIFERASRDAKTLNKEATYAHVYNAFNRVIRGLHERISLPDVEKNIVVTHIAGAAIAHLMLDSYNVLDAITLKMQSPKIVEGHDFLQKIENVDEDTQHKMQKYGALFSFNMHEHVHISLKDRFVQAKLYLAGIVSQNVILGLESDYRIDERQKAYESIVNILVRGLKLETLSKEMQNNIKTEAITILNQCENELKAFIEEHRGIVIRVAEKLKEKVFLTVDEIKHLISEEVAQEPLTTPEN